MDDWAGAATAAEAGAVNEAPGVMLGAGGAPMVRDGGAAGARGPLAGWPRSGAGGGTDTVWAWAVPCRPAAMTSARTLATGTAERPDMDAEARVSVIIIRETIGGWRRLN